MRPEDSPMLQKLIEDDAVGQLRRQEGLSEVEGYLL